MSEILYHYCSTDAFLNILRSKTFRLTCISYMNDSQEFRYLLEIALKVIESRLPGADKWSDQLTQLQTALEPDNIPDIYSACLSQEADSLSQWRAYADDGKGFTIGFSREYLQCVRLMDLENVVYDENRHRQIAEGIIDTLLGKSPGDELGADGKKMWSFLVRQSTLSALIGQAPTCKSKAFREENEVRVIYHRITDNSPLPLKFRERNGVIVPYCEIHLKPEESPILRIGLGPQNKRRLNGWALTRLLEDCKYKPANIPLYRSAASYAPL